MGHSVKKNYLYNLIYQVIIILIPLITTPYVSRVLTSSGVGLYSYTNSIATYFILFGSLGISLYAQREIAYLRDNKQKRSNTFFELFILRLITMTISILVYYFVIVRNSTYHLFYLIFIIELIATIFDISWFFQGLEEFKKTVLRQLITKIISVICIFVFVKKASDLNIYILIYVLSTLVGNLSLWFYLPKYIDVKSLKELNITKHIKPTLSLFIPQIAMQIYLVLDKTMIGRIINDMSEVGNYEQSQKIIKLSLTIVTALGTVLAPRIANKIANKESDSIKKYLQKSFRFTLFLSIPLCFGIMGISDNLIPWFLGDGYEKSIVLLKVGSLLILAISLSNVTGIQYLIPASKQDTFTKSVVIGAICNVILNAILIPAYASIGAIIASVISEIIIFIIQLYSIKDIIPLNNIFNNTYKNVISSIVMFIVVYYLSIKLVPSILNTFIIIAIGVIIYIVMVLLFKDETFNDIIKTLKKSILGGR